MLPRRAALSLGLLSSLLSVTGLPAQAAHSPLAAVAEPEWIGEEAGIDVVEVADVDAACTDVLWIGIRGGGQAATEANHRMGPQVGAAFDRYADAIVDRGEGRVATLGKHAVQFAAPGRTALLRDFGSYFAPVSPAAIELVEFIQMRQQTCPAERLVLAGFAQGASVVHRTLARATAGAIDVDRVEAVLAIADPDRAWNRSSTVHGSQIGSDPARDLGIALAGPRRLTGAGPTAGPAPYADLLVEVCRAGDLVCDPVRALGRASRPRALQRVIADNLAKARAGLVVNRSGYPTSAGTDDAVDGIVDRIDPTAFPEPLQVQELPDLTTPMFARATVPVATRGGDGRSLSAVVVDGLAAGELRLGAASGAIALTPSESGSATVEVTVEDRRGVTVSTSLVITVTPAAPETPLAALSVGDLAFHSCYVDADERAYCRGDNAHGQLGTGRGQGDNGPREVAGPGGWRVVEVGRQSTCGLKVDGSVWCWGIGISGQVGDGRGGAEAEDATEPVALPGEWSTITMGDGHVCGIRDDATLWCWGFRAYGRLGHGPVPTGPVTWEEAVQSVPSQLPGAWVDVVANESTTCAVRTDGSGWCWGVRGRGLLGDGVESAGVEDHEAAPVEVAGDHQWARIVPGPWHTCGIDVAGAVWCWGAFVDGPVAGDPSEIVPVLSPELIDVEGSFVEVETSLGATCAIDDAAHLHCWGDEALIGLDDEDGQREYLPPTEVAPARTWLDIESGTTYTEAVRGDGARCVWGAGATTRVCFAFDD